MTGYFISIIIPAYNAGQTIANCLKSIYESTYLDFECIVVDDHSSDSTLKLVEPFNPKIIRMDRQQGAAHARNQGAKAARGNILLFIDSDVTIYSDTLAKVAEAFSVNPNISALFGSYDDQPWNSNFLSQYKNLFHHYIHQTSQEDATTFWTGCGAIKKEVFLKIGGFNEQCRMMEDIELGYKLKASNYKILLLKHLVVTHLKNYNFANLLKSDFFDRAIPWTILMLSRKQFTSDLNLKITHKLSPFVLMLMILSIFLAYKSSFFLLGVPIFLLCFLIMNLDFYKFYFYKRGLAFTLKVAPLHFLYYFYSSLGFIIGHYLYYIKKITI